MHSLVKISQQTLFQLIGKVATSLSTFIILGLVTRNYGEAGTGVFTLALTYLAMFYLLADFGFNAHEIKKDNIQWQKLLGTRIIWSIALVILAVALLPFLGFATYDFSRAVLFGSFAILATGVFITCNLSFQKKLRYDLSVLASSLGTLVGLGIFIYFVSLHLPISNLVLAQSFGWVVIAGAAFSLVTEDLPIFDKQYTINLFKESWPIAVTLVLNVVYFRADSFMIAYFRSPNEVGVYNVAYSVFQSALVLPAFIMNAYYPMMLRSLKGIKFVGFGLLGLAGAGTLVTYFLSPLIISTLTGGGFIGSVQSLQILSLGLPAYFLSALLMWLMVSKNKYKSMLLVYAIGLLVNLALNFVFIPRYSFITASWTTVISEYLILGLQVIILYLKK